MKILLWPMVIIIGLPLLFFILLYGASELGGEVVTLQRTNSDGSSSNIRIWIVDLGDSSWIEHSDRQAYWITQLSESPKVTLTRNGETLDYIGSADPDSHRLYHKLRREKYTWADSLIELSRWEDAGCTGMPVRLDQSQPNHLPPHSNRALLYLSP